MILIASVASLRVEAIRFPEPAGVLVEVTPRRKWIGAVKKPRFVFTKLYEVLTLS
jgi:hypothetical protein